MAAGTCCRQECRAGVYRQRGQHGAVRVISIVRMAQLVGAAEGVLLLRGVVLHMELPLLPCGAQHHIARVADVGRLHPTLQGAVSVKAMLLVLALSG